jgi:DNA polymerase I
VSRFGRCQLEDATIESSVVDKYLLNVLNDDSVLPRQGSQPEVEESYSGGAVFDPVNGLYENVPMLDLASLYPMSILTLNISPETKVRNPESFHADTYESPNGIHFRKDKEGITRQVIEDLLEERNALKEERDSYDAGSEQYGVSDRQQRAVKVIMNCFSGDTDVMTPNGIQNIKDLEVGDEVYSFNKENESVELKPVTETHERPAYRGELVDIKTTAIDFSVTPNHRMLVKQKDAYVQEDEWHFEEAQDLKSSVGYEMPHDWDFELDSPERGRIDILDLYDGDDPVEKGGGMVRNVTRTNGNWIPRYYDRQQFAEFIGWYIADGYSTASKFVDSKSSQTSCIVQITKYPGEERDRLNDLIRNMGLPLSGTDSDHAVVCSELLYRVISSLCGSTAEEKTIPDFIWDSGRESRMQLFESLMLCDGNWQTENNGRYSTKSKDLRDGFMQLCVTLGWTPKYSRDSGIWRVRFTQNAKNSFTMHRSGSTSTCEDGVYCVSVKDNESLMAGRNGAMQFTGQSLYGVLAWNRFRLYDQDGARATTATGREVLAHTAEIAENMGYSVLYGDTDACLLNFSDEWNEDECVEKAFAVEDEINDSYGEFAREELNAESHRFDIEFEKLYRRFFQSGQKKRYAGNVRWKEGKEVDELDITGYEYRRSDSSAIANETQEHVLQMICRDGTPEEIAEYVTERIRAVEQRDVMLDEIGIPEGIGKDMDDYNSPTHAVKAAKNDSSMPSR